MNIITFILGLLVGIGLCFWQRYQLKSQLKPILTSLADTPDLLPSFPLVTLVRREIIYLQRQNQQLQTELATWETLLDLAPIGYLRIDEDNQLLWCNQQARELLNIDRWQPGQVRLLLELVRSYELDQLIEATRKTQNPQSQEWTFYLSDYAVEGKISERQSSYLKHDKSIALKASSYPLPQGQVSVFLENRQPLFELSKSRDRAFSDLTHELRTPLTAISLVTEALQKRLQNPEKLWVEQMSQETQRLMNLVQEWLDLSQLQENPSQALSYGAVELRGVILEAWQSLEPLAQQKSVTLNYSGLERIELEADRTRLIQVFVNLFDNCLKYSPADSQIQVIVASIVEPDRQNWVQVQIIDSGSGFAESDLPYIFERLYRGDRSRTRQTLETPRQGSGLGLAIVKEIIQAHGGTITAKNHPQTGGAWLQLRLPLQEAS